MKPKPPRRKKYCKNASPILFPIIETMIGPYKFSGRFNGFSVVIESLSEMNKIHSKGSFGKASYSRSFPNYNNKKEPLILRKRQFDSRQKIINKNPDIAQMFDEKNVIVVEDSDSEKEDYFDGLQPELKRQRVPIVETLNLTLEEAYFLMNALDCLKIKDMNDTQLDDESAWALFSNSQENFIQNYVAYYYFRSRKWVVKPGLKFGGDYLLYKDGPAFYHASYLVIIDILRSDTHERDTELCKRPFNWINLTGLNRLTETAAKELLICQIIWPANITMEDAKKSSNIIKQFSVNNALMRRWVSIQERSFKTEN